MAIKFRGQANKFAKSGESQNAQAFNMQSAPGPRQGVGGEDVSLCQAKSAMASRNSLPITNKAKNSPLKMNEALVSGAAATGKKFVDVSAEVGKAFKQYEPKPVAVDLGAKKAETPKEIPAEIPKVYVPVETKKVTIENNSNQPNLSAPIGVEVPKSNKKNKKNK